MTTTATAAGPTPALLAAINAAFNSRDVDRIMEFFADDCTFLMARGPEPDGRRVHGKAAVRRVLADRFKVIRDMRWEHVEQIIAGSRAVTVWMVTGKGDDGEHLNYRGCDHLRVPRRQDPEQGHVLEAGRAGGSSLVELVASGGVVRRAARPARAPARLACRRNSLRARLARAPHPPEGAGVRPVESSAARSSAPALERRQRLAVMARVRASRPGGRRHRTPRGSL